MPLPHLQNLQQFTQFIRRASLAEINALRAEDLPYGVDTQLVLEAPLEYSEQLRALIIRAKTIQKQKHAEKLAADLGEYGSKVLALANAQSISAAEHICNKQLAGLNQLKLQLQQQYSESAEQLRLNLREELHKSGAALQNYADELKAMRDFAQKRSFDKSRRQFQQEYKQAEQGISAHLTRVLETLNHYQAAQQVDKSELLQGSAHQIDVAFASIIKLQLALAQNPKSDETNTLSQSCLAIANKLPPAKLADAISEVLSHHQSKSTSIIFTLIQRLCVFCERLPTLVLNNPAMLGHSRQTARQLIDQQIGTALAMAHLFIQKSNESDWQQLAMHAKALDLQRQQQALQRALAGSKHWKQ